MLQYLRPSLLSCFYLAVRLDYPAQARNPRNNNLEAAGRVINRGATKPAEGLTPLMQSAQPNWHFAVGAFVALMKAGRSCRQVKRPIDTVLDVDRAERVGAVSGTACAPDMWLWCSGSVSSTGGSHPSRCSRVTTARCTAF